ncbi:DUF262 domain-containing protein [Alkalihalobacillus sp. FSL R5-0424]
MRLLPSDPDIQTIVARIKGGDINLQPDFQRGEVWGEPKKRRLIDSILREWHVPPIHVVEVIETAKQDVLDGQQRLVAVRDFVNGDIVVDGNTQPEDLEIVELDGLSYEKLPEKWRRKFDQFTIRIFKITDYKPEEPGELFYRLNQPSNLTAAEQRNAFFGPARHQVKELAYSMEAAGLNSATLGFSNSRMAYEDVVAKVCYALDKGTLVEKITGAKITNKYRTQEKFSNLAYRRTEEAIYLMGESCDYFSFDIKFNKATLFSWLCFIANMVKSEPDINKSSFIGEYISIFEGLRNRSKEKNYYNEDPLLIRNNSFEDHLIEMFNDRASSRAADVSSVLIRDIALWSIMFKHATTSKKYNSLIQLNKLELVRKILPPESLEVTQSEVTEKINSFIMQTNWGSNL